MHLDLATLWRRNRARLAHDHASGTSRVEGRPTHLKIELTNYCNLACPLCPHARMQRPVGYMDAALFRRIIDQAAPELEFAYLHHLGESLFHPRLGELIRYGRSRGAATGLSTNATYLDDRKSRILLDAGLDFLVISLDAATPATYAQLRIGGDFATTTAHIRAFLRLRASLRSPTAVSIQLLSTPLNHHEVSSFARTWTSLGASVMVKQPRNWGDGVRLLGSCHETIGDFACKMPWTELTVLWDGRVVPCANFYEPDLVLGDLRTQSLDDIWNGAPLRRLRAAHATGSLAGTPVCDTCPRHALDAESFIAADQLTQRLRTYLRAPDDLQPRPGLS